MNLQQFINDNNLTQEAIARYLGVNKSTVSRLASGDIRISEHHLERLINNGMGWDPKSLGTPDKSVRERSLPSWKEKMYEDMIRERDEKIRALQERFYMLVYKKDE